MNSYTKFSLFLLRVSLGWMFIYAGWVKTVTFFTPVKDWTAAGYLSSQHGIFAPFFVSMAGNPVVDYLNAYGLLLIGLATVAGLLVRWASFWGFLLMVLYWLSVFPPAKTLWVDEHVIYAVSFLILGATGAGRFWGLDQVIEESSLVKSNTWLLKVLG